MFGASLAAELCLNESSHLVSVFKHIMRDQERLVLGQEQVDALLLEIRMVYILPPIACLLFLVEDVQYFRVLRKLQRVDKSGWIQVLQLYLLFQGCKERCEIYDRHSQPNYQQHGPQKNGPLDVVHQKTDDCRDGEDGGEDERASIELEAPEDIEDEKLSEVVFTEFYCYGHAVTIPRNGFPFIPNENRKSGI